MIMKRYFIVLFSLLLAMNTAAQEKQLTAQDLIPGGKNAYRFVPQSLRQLSFVGDNYIYRQGDTLLITRPGSKKHTPWLTLDELNKGLETAGLKTIKSLPAFAIKEIAGTSYFYFYNQSSILLYNPSTQKIEYRIPYQKGDSNFAFEPQQKRLAVTNGRDLILIGNDGSRMTIAHDDNDQISFGASNVHRNEFGISSGIFWSPQGNALAFYRMDESRVTDYPLVDISTRTAALKETKYPMAGMASHEVKVGIYHTASGDTVYLRTPGEKDQYLTNIAWSPDEKNIYLQRLNRRQDTCRTEVYDATDGKLLRTLFTETSDKYVEPQYPVFFLPGRNDRFVHLSRRDGYHHLYLYNTDGKLLKQLTSVHGKFSRQLLRPMENRFSLHRTKNHLSKLTCIRYRSPRENAHASPPKAVYTVRQ